MGGRGLTAQIITGQGRRGACPLFTAQRRVSRAGEERGWRAGEDGGRGAGGGKGTLSQCLLGLVGDSDFIWGIKWN